MSIESYFTGKFVVVTGGSSGIGKSIAAQLCEAGANVCLIARRKEVLETAAHELEKKKKSKDQVLEILPLDLGERAAVDGRLTALCNRRPVDVLINNAGVAYANYLEETSPEIFDEMMRINYFGTVWPSRIVAPLMKQRKSGHIANVSSLAGILGVFGYSAYTPSKFAIMGFSDVLRGELKPYGVRVSVLLPPDTDTPQLAHENKTKPPETKAIARNAKTLSPDVVAQALLSGMVADKFHIVPGFDGKVAYYSTRFIPGGARWVIDGDVKKAIAKKG